MHTALKGHKIGLAFDTTAALLHAVWAACIGIMPEVMQKFITFHFTVHFANAPFTLQAFSWGGAVALVAYAFVVGYILGRIFSAVYNLVAR